MVWKSDKKIKCECIQDLYVSERRLSPTMCILHNQRDATYTTFFIIISVLHVSGGFSAHHQELIKLSVQPWVLSCFPAVWNNQSTPAVDSRKTWQYPRLHRQFYMLLMMGGKTAQNMQSADNNKEHCISCISLVI